LLIDGSDPVLLGTPIVLPIGAPVRRHDRRTAYRGAQLLLARGVRPSTRYPTDSA
jgi:hypothetical protein